VGLWNAVKASEQDALQTLVELFDWLDSLEPQQHDGDRREAREGQGQDHWPSLLDGPTRGQEDKSLCRELFTFLAPDT
jgi:hypothetical protein